MLPFFWHKWQGNIFEQFFELICGSFHFPAICRHRKFAYRAHSCDLCQLRNMDMKRQLCVGLGLLLAINIVHGVSAQTQFQVGDEAGWTLPSLANVNYTSWASGHKYHVGDTLLFTYVVAIHNVVQVRSQEDYDTCNSNNPIAVHGSGKTAITLTEPGPYYFICGTPGHCSLGQKLSLVAGPASLTSPSTTDSSADHKSLDSFVPHTGPLAQPPGNSGVTYLVSWVILLGAVVLSSAFLV